MSLLPNHTPKAYLPVVLGGTEGASSTGKGKGGKKGKGGGNSSGSNSGGGSGGGNGSGVSELGDQVSSMQKPTSE